VICAVIVTIRTNASKRPYRKGWAWIQKLILIFIRGEIMEEDTAELLSEAFKQAIKDSVNIELVEPACNSTRDQVMRIIDQYVVSPEFISTVERYIKEDLLTDLIGDLAQNDTFMDKFGDLVIERLK